MSRYEKIKQMSLEEIAEILCNICRNAETCRRCPFEDDCPKSEAIDAWKEWLNEQGKAD